MSAKKAIQPDLTVICLDIDWGCSGLRFLWFLCSSSHWKHDQLVITSNGVQLPRIVYTNPKGGVTYTCGPFPRHFRQVRDHH